MALTPANLILLYIVFSTMELFHQIALKTK
jgi:hypothetical protein